MNQPERIKWAMGIWRARYKSLLRDYARLKTEHEKALMKIARGKL